MSATVIVIIPTTKTRLTTLATGKYGATAVKGLPGFFEVPEHQSPGLEYDIAQDHALEVAKYLAARQDRLRALGLDALASSPTPDFDVLI